MITSKYYAYPGKILCGPDHFRQLRIEIQIHGFLREFLRHPLHKRHELFRLRHVLQSWRTGTETALGVDEIVWDFTRVVQGSIISSHGLLELVKCPHPDLPRPSRGPHFHTVAFYPPLGLANSSTADSNVSRRNISASWQQCSISNSIVFQ